MDRTATTTGENFRAGRCGLQRIDRVGNVEGSGTPNSRSLNAISARFAGPADPEYHKVETGTGKKYLDVDVLLRSQSDVSYGGRLYEDGVSAQAMPNKNEHDETEPVVTAYVKLNLDDFPEEKRIPTDQFVTGLEVSVRIRCGDHALGYSLFHGVWEWFYEKVIFYF